MDFVNIIGNENIKGLLKSSIKTNNLVHSYMFVGPDGIGKKLFAEVFSRMVLCENQEDSCNTCSSCIRFNSNNHPDFMVVDSEDRKSIKIGQIRLLQEKIAEKPIVSNKKVYIINNADLINVEAQNCLLKTLEEPPEYAVLILVLSNESKLLNTIKSRCTKIAFNKLTDDELLKYANIHNINVNSNLLGTCEGSISKLLSLNDNLSLYNSLDLIIDNLNNKDIVDVWNEAEVLYKSKDNILDFLDYFDIIFMNKLRNTNDSRYINAIKIVEKTKNRLSANANYDMCIDNLLLQIWEEFHESHNRG